MGSSAFLEMTVIKSKQKLHLGKEGHYMQIYAIVCNYGSPLKIVFDKL